MLRKQILDGDHVNSYSFGFKKQDIQPGCCGFFLVTNLIFSSLISTQPFTLNLNKECAY